MGELYDFEARRRLRVNPLEYAIDEMYRLERDPIIKLELGERVVSEILREAYDVENAIHHRAWESKPSPISELDV